MPAIIQSLQRVDTMDTSQHLSTESAALLLLLSKGNTSDQLLHDYGALTLDDIAATARKALTKALAREAMEATRRDPRPT